MIGKTISHYKILEKIGEGGMGVVYKVEDTKLKRTVALKFLPPHASGSDEEKKRSLREAHVAASLSHANICVVYDIDEYQGQTFIAMEYLKGQSLKAKIKSRPLKLKEAINIGIQIAKGLHEAHRKGIVHRDIKSANIMVTETGRVKIMDFGLAKLSGQTQITKAGTIMGTIAYMSPEQARGERVDFRTDIWSLGVVLYEMLTGQLPFKGDIDQAVTYAILNEQPEPITALRTGVPIELERIVHKLLAKEAGNRYQHVDELPVDLKAVDLESTGSSISRQTFPRSVRKLKSTGQIKMSWKLLALLLSVITIICAFVGWLIKPHTKSGLEQVVKFTHFLQPDEYFTWAGDGPKCTISPDGTKIVYHARSEGITKLYWRLIDEYYAVPIEGTAGAGRGPFFSPNSQELCFFAKGKLNKIPLLGGSAETLWEIAGDGHGVWGDNDVIIISPNSSEIYQISAIGGRIPELIVTANSNKNWHYHISEVLPGNKAVLLHIGDFDLDKRSPQPEDAMLAFLDLETNMVKLLEINGANPHYAPTGHLVFARGSSILAVPFDLKRLRVTGNEVKILDGVAWDETTSNFQFSNNGTLIYQPGGLTLTEQTLILVNREGKETLLTDKIRNYSSPRYSPNGDFIAVDICEGKNCQIWILDVKRDALDIFTTKGSYNRFPFWTPDGNYIVFTSNRSGVNNLYIKKVSDDEEAQPLCPCAYEQYGGSWSADGSLFAFCQYHPETKGDIWIHDARRDTTFPFLTTEYNEQWPTLSPDGRCIAYASDRPERRQIYITPYPGPGQEKIVSVIGNADPVWAHDSKTLFFREFYFNLRSVAVETDPLWAGPIQSVFDDVKFCYSLFRQATQYDIHPDGDQFLLYKMDIQNRINFVLNWFEELQNKCPPGS